MGQTSPTRAEIRLAGPDATYPPITFTPVATRRGHEVLLTALRITRRGERYTLDTIPLSLALPQTLGKDVIYWTLEADGTEGDNRMEAFELQMILPDNAARTSIELRAVPDKSIQDMLFYEYRDPNGSWQSFDDVLLRDILDDQFVHAMHSQVMDNLNSNDLQALPGLLEA